MTALVSVIVPMFDAEHTIEETLISVLAPAQARIEVIVVNDGSRDDSPRRVRALQTSHENLSMIFQPNAGLPSARNTGLDHAKGSHVLFLDADDVMLPGAIDVMLSASQRAGAPVAGAIEFVDEEGAPLGICAEPVSPRLGLAELFEQNRLLVHGQLLTREAIGTQRFDPELDALEDYDLWLRLAHKGIGWHPVDAVVGRCRLRSGSMSHNALRMALREQSVRRRAFDRAQSDAPAPFTSKAIRNIEARRAVYWAARGCALHNGAFRFDVSSDVIHALTPFEPLRPDALVAAAYHGLSRGLRLSPAWWWRNPGDALRLADAFWSTPAISSRCSDWSKLNLMRSLASIAIPTAVIAEAMASQIPRDERPVVCGFGTNGRHVGSLLLRHGVKFGVLDDAISQDRVVLDGASIPVVTRGEMDAWPGARLCTPVHDTELASTIPGPRPVIRWNHVRSRLAKDWEAAATAAQPEGRVVA